MGPRSVLERAARPLTGLSAGLFAGLSKARGHRVFHPHGEAFHAVITFNRKAMRWLPDVVVTPREHPAIVRFSRAIGLHDRFPDIFGMAVKIPGLYGGGGWDQDWLMVTSRSDPVGRHLLIPTMNMLGRPYSTVLPYRRDRNGLITFGAQARTSTKVRSTTDLVRLVNTGPLLFDFTVAPAGGENTTIASIELTAVRPGSEKALRFNPWNTSSELKPAGALNELRRETYVASQRARKDTA